MFPLSCLSGPIHLIPIQMPHSSWHGVLKPNLAVCAQSCGGEGKQMKLVKVASLLKSDEIQNDFFVQTATGSSLFLPWHHN